MLVGNCVAITFGAIFSILVSFCTRSRMTAEEVEAEWEITRNIDNPLSPWVQKYMGELNLEEGEHFHDRPPLDIVIRKFRPAKITAYIAGVFFTALFVCIWPGSMLSIDMLDFSGFNAWTIISRVWAFSAATFIIVVPLFQEVRAIYKQHQSNKAEAASIVANGGDMANANGNATMNGSGNSKQGSPDGWVFPMVQADDKI